MQTNFIQQFSKDLGLAPTVDHLQLPDDAADVPALRAGDAIYLVRGNPNRATGAGAGRLVRARFDGADGTTVYATLLEDDPVAHVGPSKAGESGFWHGFSFVRRAEPLQ